MPPRRLLARGLCATLLLLALGGASCANAGANQGAGRDSFFKRMFSSPRQPPALSVRFELLTDIDLPGPLPDGGPRLVDGRVVIPVAGGLAVTDWTPGSQAVVSADDTAPSTADDTAPDDADAAEWSYDPARRYRARFRDDGKLIMQRRCRIVCEGWDKIWKLRLPGTVNARPLLTEGRVYFGAPDNRVYALRKRSGDRIWAADIQERASGSVMVWDGDLPQVPAGHGGQAEPAPRQRIIVVRPDVGSRLLALDARTGKVAARYELGDGDGTLKGAPLTTPDGKILIARDKYRPDEASLMVFALSSAGGTQLRRPSDAPPEEPDERRPVVTGGAREKKGAPR